MHLYKVGGGGGGLGVTYVLTFDMEGGHLSFAVARGGGGEGYQDMKVAS